MTDASVLVQQQLLNDERGFRGCITKARAWKSAVETFIV
jgi:hypothetical protein